MREPRGAGHKFDENISGGEDFNNVSDGFAQAAKSAHLAGVDVQTISWIAITISMLLIPLYLWSAHEASNEAEWPKLNIFMALIAFPVWAYAVEAVAFRSIYDGTLAAIALAIFSVLSGAISPALLAKLRNLVARPSG